MTRKIFFVATYEGARFASEFFLFNIRDKRRFQSFGFERVPIEIFKPWVRFHFLASLHSQSLSWLPLQAPVHEVCSLFRVALRNIFILDLSLLVQNGISDFFSASSEVWSASHDALVSNYSNCKVVGCYSMVLLEHHLWSHVSRCS